MFLTAFQAFVGIIAFENISPRSLKSSFLAFSAPKKKTVFETDLTGFHCFLSLANSSKENFLELIIGISWYIISEGRP